MKNMASWRRSEDLRRKVLTWHRWAPSRSFFVCGWHKNFSNLNLLDGILGKDLPYTITIWGRIPNPAVWSCIGSTTNPPLVQRPNTWISNRSKTRRRWQSLLAHWCCQSYELQCSMRNLQQLKYEVKRNELVETNTWLDDHPTLPTMVTQHGDQKTSQYYLPDPSSPTPQNPQKKISKKPTPRL